MSILDNVFAPPAAGSPLHTSVNNARAALESGIHHLLEALGHIHGELQQAQADASMHQEALASAQARVDEFQQAAQHLAYVGQNVEALLAAGQQATTDPVAAVQNIPQDVQAVEQVVTATETAITELQHAVSGEAPVNG